MSETPRDAVGNAFGMVLVEIDDIGLKTPFGLVIREAQKKLQEARRVVRDDRATREECDE